MSDIETEPRKPRGTRKAPSAAIADDWPSVVAAGEATAELPAERQRVAKAMARAGLCSRRDAEAWILEGRVKVNGEVLASPARDVGPGDRVEVDGAPLPAADKTRLFLFHKPRGLVTSDHDPEGRETVTDYLREHWPQGPRVVTVGRLDINTEGLLLLTNDGGLARMLELPKTGWLRRYRVRANGETDQAKLDALFAGIEIDGIEYAGIEAKLDRNQGANCWLTMGLREGKNREIKRVLEHLGLEVNRLIRLSFGPFQLLDLAEGAVEEVRTRVLKDQLGLALAAEAGVDFGDAPALEALPARSSQDKTGRNKTGEDVTGGSRAEPGSKPTRDASPRGSKRVGSPARGRSGDPRPQQSRAAEQKGGERPLRRREAPASVATEERARPRRHVSTMRTTEAEAARSGPRKRVERTDTRDRNERTVTVERKVSARPAGVSPSADGKRARIARSGGARQPAGEGRDEGQRRETRGADVSFGAGGERRSARPARNPAGDDRPQRVRREDGERTVPARSRSAPGGERRDTRPARTPGGDRPQRARREDSERAAPARSRSAPGGERRDARPTRTAGGDRPQRARREDGERAAPARSRSAPGGERRDARPTRAAGGDRPQRARREDGERAAPARSRSGPGGERRDARPARAPGGDRPQRARREDGERAAPSRSGGERPQRIGTRPPRDNRAGRPDGAASAKPRGAPKKPARDAGAPASRGARGPYKGSSDASGKRRPSGGAGSARPPGRGAPGGKPDRPPREPKS